VKFIDEVVIECRSGRGGDGAVHFRRERYVPRGGPDGGDGGHGGSVILEADPQLNTLLHLRYAPHQRAAPGRPGGAQRATGRRGRDRIVRVPTGTIVWSADDEMLADLDQPGDRWVAAQGGRGGRGNAHFKSSTNRTPNQAQPGGSPVERSLRLELRLLADVALLGYPNAGKSTLISVLSAARPRIADYPFTTLAPNLGMVQGSDYRSIVVADIPGLIEGAASGKGLGNRFLRHVERTRLLCHLVSVAPDEAEEPLIRYEKLRIELRERARAEESGVDQRLEVVVLSKIDAADPADLEAAAAAFAELGIEVLPISSATGEGVNFLRERLLRDAHDVARAAPAN
jgi:GTP-binding protein